MLLILNNFTNFFDNNIFLYGEDAELSKRKLDEGYKNIMVKKSFVYHEEHLSCKVDNKLQEYKMIFFRYWHMGWSKLYLKRKRKPYYRLFFNTLQKLLFSIKKLLTLDKINFIKYFATFCGMLSNLMGIDCSRKENKSPQIKYITHI